MAAVNAQDPAEAAQQPPEPAAKPQVDVAAVLRALDPFWTRAINDTKSLTAEAAAEEEPDEAR